MCISKRFQLLIIEWNADDRRKAPLAPARTVSEDQMLIVFDPLTFVLGLWKALAIVFTRLRRWPIQEFQLQTIQNNTAPAIPINHYSHASNQHKWSWSLFLFHAKVFEAKYLIKTILMPDFSACKRTRSSWYPHRREANCLAERRRP